MSLHVAFYDFFAHIFLCSLVLSFGASTSAGVMIVSGRMRRVSKALLTHPSAVCYTVRAGIKLYHFNTNCLCPDADMASSAEVSQNCRGRLRAMLTISFVVQVLSRC